MRCELYQLEGTPGLTITSPNAIRVKRSTSILDVTFDVEKNTATVLTTCSLCQKPAIVEALDADAVITWLNQGVFIQDAFPARSAGDREILLSGTHDECFDNAFPDEDEECEHEGVECDDEDCPCDCIECAS
jgi:hypothetical protein